ncbi:MAG: helix-turn-helix domain-containing protein [Gammaproteobacteria bacterium]
MNGERQPNLRLRRARTALGQTQAQVAEALGVLLGHPVDPEYIGRLERGVLTWPHGYHREAFRAHFGVASDEELGFYCSRSTPAPPWEDDDVRRRVVLGGLPLVGLATAGPLAAVGPLAALVDAAMAESSLVPRRVGVEHVAQVRALAGQAHEMFEQFGGGGAQQMLGGQVRWAVSLLDAYVDPAASRDVHSAVGHLARKAGWSSHDMGVDAAAQRYYQVALRCAEDADDWSLRGKSLLDLSRIAEYSGDGETALTLAQQAMVRPDRLTSLERVWVSAAESRAYGRRGDVQACRAAVGRTEEYFAAADPVNESPAMVVFSSPAELAEGTGGAQFLMALRGHAVIDTARRLRTAADTHGPGSVLGRIVCLAQLSTLQFTQGDPEAAVAVANTCLDTVGAVRSRRVLDHLIGLRTATTQHRYVTGVADLRQRLNRALTSA